MAEIKITKKKTVWPWILLLLIIIGGLFFLYYYGSTEKDELTDDDSVDIEVVTFVNPEYSNSNTLLSTVDS